MFNKVKWGAVTLASALLAGSLGLASPALAAEAPELTTPEEAMLTKVIKSDPSINIYKNGNERDTYTFRFTGGGTVGNDHTSNGVAQDSVTIKIGDEIPNIPDKILEGVNVPKGNGTSIPLNNQQAIVQVSIANILNNGTPDTTGDDIVFPHAGVYTYKVTEPTTTNTTSGAYIIRSQAEYTMRLYVINDETTGQTKVSGVTVQRDKDDEGSNYSPGGTNGDNSDNAKKMDPTYPKDTSSPKDSVIDDEIPADIEQSTGKAEDGTLKGDSNGRNVYGFTFTNEYVKGNTVTIQKVTKGDYADKSKLFDVTVELFDAGAAGRSNINVSYVVDDGNGNGSSKSATFGKDYTSSDQGTDIGGQFGGAIVRFKAQISDTGTITINGITDIHGTMIQSGLNAGTTITVTEAGAPNYTASGYFWNKNTGTTAPTATKSDGVYVADAPAEGVTKSFTGKQRGEGVTVGSTNQSEDNLHVTTSVDGGYIYLLNIYNDNAVTPTGILINNLPYVLMVGIPVAVGAVMFVNKRRQANELD